MGKKKLGQEIFFVTIFFVIYLIWVSQNRVYRCYTLLLTSQVTRGWKQTLPIDKSV